MFIGHYAVAFAAKKVAPRTSLGTFFLSVQLVDLLWPIMLLMGLERVQIAPEGTAFTTLVFTHYPITHSTSRARSAARLRPTRPPSPSRAWACGSSCRGRTGWTPTVRAQDEAPGGRG